ncbi:MAG TPA: NAD(P)(+) transhydrogenase (Re/Si-specific) subunit beta [Gemmatimonadota bacterium]|nr:NAD(P)(+) transhydrogenase (Re/Si-specific) subunit beta [Gemmatimonadota bacterium]
MGSTVFQLAYLVSAILFIVGLQRLSSPETARGGNAIAALGMLIAIVATLLGEHMLSFTWILVGAVIGSGAGLVMAQTVKMTAMPQMVAIFNGFGGGASALVAVAEYLELAHAPGATLETAHGVSIMAGVLIGSVTLSGSFVAFGKLQGLVTEKPVTYPLQKTSNFILLIAMLAVGTWLSISPPAGGIDWFYFMIAASLVLGILVVIPIGGADMPVVIALLNSYSGLAASAAGFVLVNMSLIISGALVGASGLILTGIMCRGMNRSLANVLFGAFGGGGGAATGGGGGPGGDRTAREIDAESAAMMLAYARQVVIVPGYGLAVAQAQHKLRELADLLVKRGVTVKYAIHPVAGRMPGHMNVLLAEANVPYDQLYEPEDVNPEMPDTDVALVVGANDVTNPAARDDPASPIAGMPIVEVDRARQCIVMKRSLSTGFAGVDNPLFYLPNNAMLFGDAADTLTQLVREVKEL